MTVGTHVRPGGRVRLHFCCSDSQPAEGEDTSSLDVNRKDCGSLLLRHWNIFSKVKPTGLFLILLLRKFRLRLRTSTATSCVAFTGFSAGGRVKIQWKPPFLFFFRPQLRLEISGKEFVNGLMLTWSHRLWALPNKAFGRWAPSRPSFTVSICERTTWKVGEFKNPSALI